VNYRRDDVSDHTAQEQTLYPAVSTTLEGFATDTLPASGGTTQYNFALAQVQPVAFYSFGVYFQDEYRVNSHLKLTLALRADRNSGGVCQHHCAGLPVKPFDQLTHGANIPYNQSFQTGLTTIVPHNELLAWQPRFGLAWTPWGSNTVIRTGFGIFSDLYPGTELSAFDTNFPQVNLWTVAGVDPAKTGGQSTGLAWDLLSPSSTAFPNSGVALVQQCNSIFNTNFFNGGNFNTYQAALTPATAGCLSTPALNDVTRDLKNAKFIEWNLEIQHSFGTRTAVSANYVGNHGYDLLYTNPNLNSFGFGDLPATLPDPRVGHVTMLNSGAISNYHGLTLSIEENGWHGLTGRFSYTWSHALDEISNAGVFGTPFSVLYSVPVQIDPSNLSANYASADYDARHQLSGSYIYDLPFRSHTGVVNSVIGGWQLSGTMFYRTSFPFSFIDGATIGGLAANNLVGVPNASALLQPEFSQRNFPNAAACTVNPCFQVRNPDGTLPNAAPFVLDAATNFTGAVGRNAFRGPGFLGGDMSLRKNFSLTESMRLQVGLNAYNWLNHANYGIPYSNTNFSSIFGTVFFMQSPPTSPYGAFAAASTDMRMAQITTKLTF
jgi:hypothetical protein